MKMFFCQMIAIVCILAVGFLMVTLFVSEDAEADRYKTREWWRFIDIRHNNGDITEHITDTDISYSTDHSIRTHSIDGSEHWHDGPELKARYGGSYTCFLNSSCSLCD